MPAFTFRGKGKKKSVQTGEKKKKRSRALSATLEGRKERLLVRPEKDIDPDAVGEPFCGKEKKKTTRKTGIPLEEGKDAFVNFSKEKKERGGKKKSRRACGGRGGKGGGKRVQHEGIHVSLLFVLRGVKSKKGAHWGGGVLFSMIGGGPNECLLSPVGGEGGPNSLFTY